MIKRGLLLILPLFIFLNTTGGSEKTSSAIVVQSQVTATNTIAQHTDNKAYTEESSYHYFSDLAQIIILHLILLIIVIHLFLYFRRKHLVNREKNKLVDNITRQTKKVEEKQQIIDELNKKISLYEQDNRFLISRIDNHLNLSRYLAEINTNYIQDIRSVFPGKSYIVNNSPGEENSDFHFINYSNEHCTIINIDYNTDPLNKAIIQLSLANHLKELLQSPQNCATVVMEQKINEFFQQMPSQLLKAGPHFKLALLCIDLNDHKFKCTCKGYSLYVAIARSTSLSGKTEGYHELQKIEQEENTLSNANYPDDSNEFKLKNHDRLYIINNGDESYNSGNIQKDDVFEHYITDLLNKHHQMDIIQQGQFIKKEMRVKATIKGQRISPDNFILRALEI